MNKRQLSAAVRFHGHLGPWLVLGLRAGSYARRRFRCSPFEITAIVHCPRTPPVRCILDGIQLSAGCTYGKGNISHRLSNRSCLIRFRHRRQLLELLVRPEIFQVLSQISPAATTTAACRLSRLPLHRLFIVKPKPENTV
ncbi:MAG: formylmethanofuran dehydrogenase subunit E family protein [candidate division WOR-3 bacterium]|jgi:formylmethanofuran dehydrogenase subunit E